MHYGNIELSVRVDDIEFEGLPIHEETEDILRKSLKTHIPNHVTFNLDALSDENPITSKHMTVFDLIKFAIWGSKNKRLTLGQIYAVIEDRWPFLKYSEDKPWQVSSRLYTMYSRVAHPWLPMQRTVRHTLSLKAMFVQVPRPKTDPGNGAYWVIDIRNGLGDSRPRKRKDNNSTTRSNYYEENFSIGNTSGAIYLDSMTNNLPPVPYGNVELPSQYRTSRYQSATMSQTLPSTKFDAIYDQWRTTSFTSFVAPETDTRRLLIAQEAYNQAAVFHNPPDIRKRSPLAYPSTEHYHSESYQCAGPAYVNSR